MAAADGQFTGAEQGWIDKYFGADASDRFLGEYTDLEWDHCFEKIRAITTSLSEGEKKMLDQGLRIWLLELLSVDGIANEELEQLDVFMTFLERAKTDISTPRSDIESVSPQVESSACPKCGATIETEQVLCMACGFNSHSGQTIKMQTGKADLRPPVKTQQNVNYHPNVPSDKENTAWGSEPTESIYITEESSGCMSWVYGILAFIGIVALLGWWDPDGSIASSRIETIHNKLMKIESDFVDDYNVDNFNGFPPAFVTQSQAAQIMENKTKACRNAVRKLGQIDLSRYPEDYAEGVRSWRSSILNLQNALKGGDGKSSSKAVKQCENAVSNLNSLAGKHGLIVKPTFTYPK